MHMLGEGKSAGELSLQNALETASRSLSQIPSYGSREVLVVTGSLSTVDPGNIFDTIAELRHNHVRVSVIGLSAEIFVCKTIADKTGGKYHVALDKEHFRNVLMAEVPPVVAEAGSHAKLARKWIRMGFPQQQACSC